jgi:hypothetical protein
MEIRLSEDPSEGIEPPIPSSGASLEGGHYFPLVAAFLCASELSFVIFLGHFIAARYFDHTQDNIINRF